MKQWAPTWLKRLGRVWEPFHENFKTIRKRAMSIDLPTVLRPLGLRILSDFRNKTEPRKKVVYQSLPAVLTRSLIHLVPATVSIVLVVVNCNGIFVGRELTGESGRDDVKNAAIQIAAKIQELFILSSLGSIVLHLIRERLLFGEGVALGLLGSDKAFSQVTFFLSTDFWGGFASYFGKGKSSRYWCEGLILGVLLLFGGVLALLAGPSTAVLMQPRSQPVSRTFVSLSTIAADLRFLGSGLWVVACFNSIVSSAPKWGVGWWRDDWKD